MHTMRDSKALPEEKTMNSKLLKKINQWCPNGVDLPTFLQCTECTRRVCPGCCGVCPVIPCHDRLCKVCSNSVFLELLIDSFIGLQAESVGALRGGTRFLYAGLLQGNADSQLYTGGLLLTYSTNCRII